MATFKHRTDNREEILLGGKDPDRGTIGLPPNRGGRAQIDPSGRSKYLADMQDRNPRYDEFQNESRTFEQVAPLSQDKINRAASTEFPNFMDPGDNEAAINFLQRYKEGVYNGLISEDDRVGPDKIGYISTQPAMTGSNASNPNTAGTFPGASGVNI